MTRSIRPSGDAIPSALEAAVKRVEVVSARVDTAAADLADQLHQLRDLLRSFADFVADLCEAWRLDRRQLLAKIEALQREQGREPVPPEYLAAALDRFRERPEKQG